VTNADTGQKIKPEAGGVIKAMTRSEAVGPVSFDA
jgi:hypothetical protein